MRDTMVRASKGIVRIAKVRDKEAELWNSEREKHL